MFTAVKQKKKRACLKDFSVLDTIVTFFVLGVIFGAVYDFFRFFRLLFNNKAVTFILDFIYFIIISVLFFIALLGYNNGMVRSYYVVLAVLGFLFYIFTVFRITEKPVRRISSIIRKTFKKILQFVKRLYYNLFNKVHFSWRKVSKQKVKENGGIKE